MSKDDTASKVTEDGTAAGTAGQPGSDTDGSKNGDTSKGTRRKVDADKSSDFRVFIVSCGVIVGCFGWYVITRQFPTTDFELYMAKFVIGVAGAGFVTVVGGVLEIESALVKNTLRASGALGVFLLSMMYPVSLPAAGTDARFAYVMKQTQYVVDLRGWKDTTGSDPTQPTSEVDIYRKDWIKKTSSTNRNVELFFGTKEGLKVDYKELNDDPELTYAQYESKDVKNIDPWRTPLEKNYYYTIQLANKQLGTEKQAEGKFIFWNAFQDLSKEWFATETKYPTDKVVVTFLFPDSKPCKTMQVNQINVGESKPINVFDDNQPTKYFEGKMVTWCGQDLEGGHKFNFNWTW